ncbi:MAG TPA: hypothetical protein VD965_07985 [Burkholderiales bacterium]|nr:hypothetical protein [Burkholderiales bacterium]
MSEGGAALTRFAFANGVWRGTHLTLFPTCLVHRSENHVETLPIAGMTGVRVAFERDTRKIGWGIGLIVLALLLLAISGPIERFATEAAAEMAKSEQGVGRALYAFFRALVALASLLPVAALGCVVGGAALAALGWMGSTTLIVSLPGAERVYPARGRDTALLGFAEAVSERLMLRR